MKRKYTYIIGEKRKVRSKAHTLRDRIVFLSILIFLVSYLLWSVEFLNNRMRTKQALLDISQIKHAARLFRADFGRCPDSLDELAFPSGDFQYIRETTDPWGGKYKLICPARLDPGGVDVLSGGPNKTFNGNSVISSL